MKRSSPTLSFIAAAAVYLSAAALHAQNEPKAAAPRGSTAEPPVLIKLVADYEANQRDQAEKRKVMEQAERDFAAARKAARPDIENPRSPAEIRELEKKRDEAAQKLTQATLDHKFTVDKGRELEKKAVAEGIKLPAAETGDSPLGPTRRDPLQIEGGPLFEQLKNRMEPTLRLDPTKAPVFYDNSASGGEAVPDVYIDKLLKGKAELAQVEAETRRQEEEWRRNEAAEQEFHKEQARNFAAARQEAQRSQEIQALVQEINNHVDAAALVDRASNAAIAAYNQKTDQLYYRYKQLTGKAPGFRYERAR